MSNRLDTIYRGEDKSIGFSLTDQDDQPLSLTDFSAIMVLILDSSKQTVEEFEYPTTPGQEEITFDNASQGEMSIKLKRSKTLDIKLGAVFAEIKVRKAIPGFESGQFDSIAVEQIAVAEDSNSKNNSFA